MSLFKFFAHSQFYKLVRCTEILKETTIGDDQENEIREYHIKNNHRGIDETLAHLKRTMYFTHMK